MFKQYGHTTIWQDRRLAHSGPMDLVLFHTSRPSETRTFDASNRGIMVVFPGELATASPTAIRATDRDGAARPGRCGQAAHRLFVNPGLRELTIRAGRPATIGRRCSRPAKKVFLAHHLDAEESLPGEVRERSLLLRVRAFIRQHLPDPDLSPAVVAAAHGLSVRSLQRLFEKEDVGVAAIIRTERLARCRRDLAEPSHDNVPIYAVAARWGFPDARSFSRAFRTAFGITPQEHRRAAAQTRSPGNGFGFSAGRGAHADHPLSPEVDAGKS